MPPETLELGTPEDDSSSVPTGPKTLHYAVSLDTIDKEGQREYLDDIFPQADRIFFVLEVLDKSCSFFSEEIHPKKQVKWPFWERIEIPHDVVSYKADNSEKNVKENSDSSASANSGTREAKNPTMVNLKMKGWWSSSTEYEFKTLVGEIEAAKLFHSCGASQKISICTKEQKDSPAEKSFPLTILSSPLDEDLEKGLQSVRVYIYGCTSILGYKATFLHANVYLRDGPKEVTVQESKCSHGGIVSFQAERVDGLRITSGHNTVAVHLKDIKNTTIPSWHGDNYVSAYCPFYVCKTALEKLERLGKIFVQVQPQLKKLDKALIINVLSRDAALETLSSTGGTIDFASEKDKSDFLDALESNGMGGVDTEALIQLSNDLAAVTAQSASDIPPEAREEALQRVLVRLLLAVLLPNPERRTQETERTLMKSFVSEQRRACGQADPVAQPTMPDLNHELQSFKEALRKNLKDLVALHEAIHVPESCFDIMYMRASGNASDDSMETKLLRAAIRADFETCKRILQTHPEVDPFRAGGPSTEKEFGVSKRNAADTESDPDQLQGTPQSSLDYLIAAIARIRTERSVFGLTENSRDKEMSRRFKAAKLQELQSARDVVALMLERGTDAGRLFHIFVRALRSFDVKTLQLMVRNERICRAANLEHAWEFVRSNWRAHPNVCSELSEILLDVQVSKVSHQVLCCSEGGDFYCPNDTMAAANILRALFRERFGDNMMFSILRKMLKSRQCESVDILISLFSQVVISSSSWTQSSPFHLACELGYTRCVQEFVSHGVNVDLQDIVAGKFVLQVAIENRRTEVLRILCNSGASCSTAITKDGRTPLHLAIDMKSPEMVAVLCENGAESDERALLATVDLGHVEILQILQKVGNASPNQYRGELNRTLLHLACNKPDAGDDEFVQKLIQMNVAVNEVDMIGRTALHNAAAMGNLSAVRSLLEAGADETLPTRREGSTVIHEAAKMGRMSVLQFVLRNASGETVDAVDMQGRTPLCYAFKRRKFLELTFYCLRELQASAREKCVRECTVSPEIEAFADLLKSRYGRFDFPLQKAIDTADALRGIGRTREMVELARRIRKCFEEAYDPSSEFRLSKEVYRKIENSPEMRKFVRLIMYRTFDFSGYNVEEAELSKLVRDLHLYPSMQFLVHLIDRSYEEPSMPDSKEPTGLEDIESSNAVKRIAAIVKQRIVSVQALRGISRTREMSELVNLIIKRFRPSDHYQLSTEDLQSIEVAPEMKAFVELIKNRYRDLDALSPNFKVVDSSELVRDLHVLPLMRQFVCLIRQSCEIPSRRDRPLLGEILNSIESSYELREFAVLIHRRIGLADSSCTTAHEVRVFKFNLVLASGSAFCTVPNNQSTPNLDGEILSFFPQDICQNLQLLSGDLVKDEKELQDILRNCYEELFVETRKADAVLGILLDAGADIDHVDDQGNPAFDDDYRIEYFKTREEELRAALEKRSKLAHDQPIFKGKIVHHAVHAAWVQQGFRCIACCALVYWVILLALLTLVAIRYSGCDVYESFSIQASVVNRMSSGDAGTLEDVKDLDSWNDYVENVFVEAIWPSQSDLHVDADSWRFGQGLVLLGRPRYRQIRTRADSCSATMPSILSVVETPCYAPYSQGTFSSLDATVEDRSSHECMLRGAESHVINWEDSPAVPFFGKFGFYKGGGSSVVLSSNKTATQQLLQDLRSCEFISMGTRLAALEVTLYSRSHELFVHGRVFMEHTTTGGVFADQRWETRKLVSYESTDDRHRLRIEVMMTILFLVHFSREIYRLLDSTRGTQKQKIDGASEQAASNDDDDGARPDFSKIEFVVVLDSEEKQWWFCHFEKLEEGAWRAIASDRSRSFASEYLERIQIECSESRLRRFSVGEHVRVRNAPGRKECQGTVVSVNECNKRLTYSVLSQGHGSKLIQDVPEDTVEVGSDIPVMKLRKRSYTKDPLSDANRQRSERRNFHFRLRGWMSGAQRVWQSNRVDNIVKMCTLALDGLPAFWQRVWQSIQPDRIVKTCAQLMDNLPAYWSDPFNYLDLSIMLLFFWLVVTHVKLVHGAAQRSSDWLENSERDVFIDVSDLMRLSTVRQYLLGGVVFLCYLKTLEYLRVAATFAVPVMIIIGMLAKLMSFLIILVVFVLAFGIFDYVVFGLKYAPVNSVMKALVFTLRGALGELDFDGKYEMDQVVGTGMTMLAAVLLVILLLNLLIAVMSEAYEDVKATAEARWCYRQYKTIHDWEDNKQLRRWYEKGRMCWRMMAVRPLLCRMCKSFRSCPGLDSSEKDRPSRAREWPCRSIRVTPSALHEESQVKSGLGLASLGSNIAPSSLESDN